MEGADSFKLSELSGIECKRRGTEVCKRQYGGALTSNTYQLENWESDIQFSYNQETDVFNLREVAMSALMGAHDDQINLAFYTQIQALASGNVSPKVNTGGTDEAVTKKSND